MIDDKRLRLIAAIVIMGIGASYMLWLALEYMKSMRLDEYIRNSMDKWAAGAGMGDVLSKIVPSTVDEDNP